MRKIKLDYQLLLLAVPGILFLFVFNYIPMFGVLIAFKDYNVTEGIFNSPWNNFENFKFFLSSDQLARVLFNTIYLNLLFIIFTTLFSVALALLLNELRIKFVKRVSQTIVFLPYFISWVVISMMIDAFLGGQNPLVNSWLTALGIESPNWYTEAGLWPWILTLCRVWQGAGYLAIIYLAVITGISEDIYEAARIDGASRLQIVLRITLPLLVPTIIILNLLAIGRIFYGDFAMVYAIIGDNGPLFPTTDVIDTFVFRALRKLGDLGMASAVGVFQSIAGFIVIITVNWLVRKYSKDSALF